MPRAAPAAGWRERLRRHYTPFSAHDIILLSLFGARPLELSTPKSGDRLLVARELFLLLTALVVIAAFAVH